jgi:hypothetical protein
MGNNETEILGSEKASCLFSYRGLWRTELRQE